MQLFSSSAMQLGFNFHFKHPFILGKVRYSCFRTYLSSAKNYCVDNIKKKIQQRRQTVWQAHWVVEFPVQLKSVHFKNTVISDAVSGWEFESSFNPITTRGQNMPTTLLLAHPDLKTQRHLCQRYPAHSLQRSKSPEQLSSS